MKRFKLILIAAAVLLTWTVSAQQTIKVACIGNSITVGVGAKDPKANGYPAVLAQLLGNGYEVRNFGASGYTMLKNGDRPFWKHAFFKASQEFAPDIVVLKLGTNDSKAMNWDKHAAEFENDCRELIKTYQNLPSHPKVYVCYPIWVVGENWTIREKVISGEIIPILEKVARECGASVIDLHKTLYGMPQLIPDKVHPNELGYVLIAKEVYDRIK